MGKFTEMDSKGAKFNEVFAQWRERKGKLTEGNQGDCRTKPKACHYGQL